MPKHSHARVYFTPKVAEAILQRIAEGEPLLRICGPERQPGMPDRSMVHAYLRKDKDFRRAYLIARELQAETLADEIIDIADGRNPVPGETPSVGRDWLRVTARQWLAGVMSPKTYGRSVMMRDELAELEAEREPLDETAMAARIAAIFEAARLRQEAGGAGAEPIAALAMVEGP